MDHSSEDTVPPRDNTSHGTVMSLVRFSCETGSFRGYRCHRFRCCSTRRLDDPFLTWTNVHSTGLFRTTCYAPLSLASACKLRGMKISAGTDVSKRTCRCHVIVLFDIIAITCPWKAEQRVYSLIREIDCHRYLLYPFYSISILIFIPIPITIPVAIPITIMIPYAMTRESACVCTV